MLADRGGAAHGYEELLDLFQGTGHAKVGLRYRCRHLDQHMELHAEVCVLGFTTFAQLLLLQEDEELQASAMVTDSW